MSLVVCIAATDGIVLAADSRGTIGDPRGLTAINDTQVKIFPLGNCGIGLVGASEMGAVLLDEYRKQGLGSVPNIDEAILKVNKISSDLFSGWFRSMPHNQWPAVLLTVAGYRVTDSGPAEPMVYMLTSQLNFAPQLFHDKTCLSGVPQYAVYLLHRYHDQSIPLARAKALAEYLIRDI